MVGVMLCATSSSSSRSDPPTCRATSSRASSSSPATTAIATTRGAVRVRGERLLRGVVRVIGVPLCPRARLLSHVPAVIPLRLRRALHGQRGCHRRRDVALLLPHREPRLPLRERRLVAHHAVPLDSTGAMLGYGCTGTFDAAKRLGLAPGWTPSHGVVLLGEYVHLRVRLRPDRGPRGTPCAGPRAATLRVPAVARRRRHPEPAQGRREALRTVLQPLVGIQSTVFRLIAGFLTVQHHRRARPDILVPALHDDRQRLPWLLDGGCRHGTPHAGRAHRPGVNSASSRWSPRLWRRPRCDHRGRPPPIGGPITLLTVVAAAPTMPRTRHRPWNTAAALGDGGGDVDPTPHRRTERYPEGKLVNRHAHLRGLSCRATPLLPSRWALSLEKPTATARTAISAASALTGS